MRPLKPNENIPIDDIYEPNEEDFWQNIEKSFSLLSPSFSIEEALGDMIDDPNLLHLLVDIQPFVGYKRHAGAQDVAKALPEVQGA